ncbi:MAG: phosphatidate cytidylyltransferase [Mariprofundaceae bacterium]|nr:phosphatidate cytidylyltransferase [Mariprofundaceae bacterium]
MNELSKRIITAIFLVAGAIYWMFYTTTAEFNFLTVVIGLLAVLELLSMLALGVGLLYMVSLLIPCLFWLWSPETIPLMFLLLVPTVFWLIIFIATHRFSSSAEAFSRFVFAQWMTVLLMLFCFSLIKLHALEGGILFLSGAFLGVWLADISAYFVGKRWGRNKLCPAISPGKSVEGFLGGLLLGTLTASLFWIQMLGMSALTAMVLAVVLVLVSVVGDLGESALKRAVGVKDSGKMLPGHGGILDRIDALLPAIPVVALLWLVIR